MNIFSLNIPVNQLCLGKSVQTHIPCIIIGDALLLSQRNQQFVDPHMDDLPGDLFGFLQASQLLFQVAKAGGQVCPLIQIAFFQNLGEGKIPPPKGFGQFAPVLVLAPEL